MSILTGTVLREAIEPALKLLPANMDTPAARVMLLAIGLQESGLTARAQIVNGGARGPARGLWQFENGGGVRGVLEDKSTTELARKVCSALGVPATRFDVWGTLEHSDVLAAAFARLFLWTDRGPLPAVGDQQAGWDCYLRTWRPGKPHPDRWPGNYAAALAAVR